MAMVVDWSKYLADLKVQIDATQSFMDDLNSGTMRLQKREASQTEWTDYTESEIVRCKESLDMLRYFAAKIEADHLPPKNG